MNKLILLLFLASTINNIYGQGQAPAYISANLKLWIRANLNVFTDTGITDAVNGSLVQQWNDKSSNNNHAVQTNSLRRPIYRDNVNDYFNYNPTIEIDKSLGITNADYLSMNQTLLPNSNSPRTIFIVVLPKNSGNGSVLFFGDATAANNGDFMSLVVSPTIFRQHFGNFTSTTTFNNNIKPAIYCYYLPSAPINTGDTEFRKNGEETTETETGGTEMVTTDPDYATIGAAGFSSITNPSTNINDYWDGLISELCIYDTALSLLDIQKIETYLAVKHGITLSNINGGSNGDYIHWNGATVWDASINPAYHNDIISIARVVKEQLFQKQSHTFDDTTRIYIGNLATSNKSNPETFKTFGVYVIAGRNSGQMCATLASNSEIPAGCNIYSRLEREWKIKTKSTTSELFNMDFKLNNCANPTMVNTSELRFLVDDDGDFSNGGTTCYFNGDGTGIVISHSNPVITISNISNTHIPNNSLRYITIASTEATTPLPIELINFDATNINNTKIQLDWQTEEEINNDYFTVERSLDAINWEQTAQVDGAGNSSLILNYKLFDENPSYGISYYRLKQTDFNGQLTYSRIRSVNITADNNSTISIFPTLSSNIITVTGSYNEIDLYRIYNLHGEDVTNRLNIIQRESAKLVIDVSKLSSGIYYLKTKTLSNKFIKQ